MQRKVSEELLDWKNNPEHKSLIIMGCRQCGKTYAVMEFAEKHYSNVISINFETNPEKKDYFEGPLDSDTLLHNIALYENTDIVKGRTVLILDEIQACSRAYSSLKPLSGNGICDVIALGSFLGINLEDSDDGISPLGYVDTVNMNPMDFEEFLWAMGVRKEIVDEANRCISERTPLPSALHRAMSDMFRRYLVIGGMPEAVRTYVETSSYPSTMKVLKDIVSILMRDSGKYSRKAGRSKINLCFLSIPEQISRDNKRFQYTDVEKKKNIGKRTYGSALSWLVDAGIALRCHNLDEIVPPLSESVKEDDFKIYLTDTGILAALMDSFDPSDLVLRDPYSNHGAFMESAVASALQKKGYPLYYYRKENSTLEVDFVIRMDKAVTILEVKSGRKRRSRSLKILMAEKDRYRKGIRIVDGNIKMNEGILEMPLYAPCFFKINEIRDIPTVDVEAINSINID